MACPNCSCKETYLYDDEDYSPYASADDYERCAACGCVFYIDEHLPEDEDHGQ